MVLSLGSVQFDLGVKVRQSQFKGANDNLLKIQKQIGGVRKDALKMNRSFQTAARGMVSATRRIGRSMGTLRRRVFSLKGALLGIGVGLVAKGFLDVARETENLKIQLKFLTDNADDAASAFRQMNKFASEVPFTLREIQAGGASLLTVTDNVDELNEIMTLTADIAAATGLSFAVTAQQIQRSFSAGIGGADLFREKAVGAMLGFEQGVKISAEATRDHIIKAFRDGTTSMKGAAAEMATTFDGTMSQISDKWFQFRRAFMDSAPFDFIKSAFIVLNNDLNARFGEIEDAAVAMGDKFIETFKRMILGAAGFADFISPIVSAVDRVIEKWLGVFGFDFTTQAEFEAAQAELKALEETATKIIIPLALVPADNPDLTFRERAQQIIAEIEEATTSRRLQIEITPSAVSGDTKGGTAVAEALRAQQRAVQDIDFGDAIQQLQEFLGAEVKVTSAGQAMMDMFAEGRAVIAANVTDMQAFNMQIERLAELQNAGAINAEQMATAQERLRDAMRLDAGIIDPLREYNNELARLQELLNANIITQGQFSTALEGLQGDFIAANKGLATMEAGLQRIGKATISSMLEGQNAMEAFKQTAFSVIRDILAEWIAAEITKALMALAIQALSGGTIPFSAGRQIAEGALGPSPAAPQTTAPAGSIKQITTFAHGGPIAAGQFGLVGERGPELFKPNVAGSIVPFREVIPNLTEALASASGPTLPTDMIRKMMATGNSSKTTNITNTTNIIQDFRGVKGSREIEDTVLKAMRIAAPKLIDAATFNVRDEKRRNPGFFGS